MRAVLRVACIALAAYGAVPAALADDSDPEVDLQLVLAVDISRSMDLGELQVQRDGYVAAFRHPEVIQAIGSGFYGKIAVTYLEWAGYLQQDVVVPWRVISNSAEANGFANELALAPISSGSGTSISGGLMYSGYLLRTRPAVEGARRAIDVSGDGANNSGNPVLAARNRLVKEGVVINGLPVVIHGATIVTTPTGPLTLDKYYKECVIGGPGAFMIVVSDTSDFETAIRRKLVLEIAGLPATVQPAQLRPLIPAADADCLIGERMRR